MNILLDLFIPNLVPHMYTLLWSAESRWIQPRKSKQQGACHIRIFGIVLYRYHFFVLCLRLRFLGQNLARQLLPAARSDAGMAGDCWMDLARATKCGRFRAHAPSVGQGQQATLIPSPSYESGGDRRWGVQGWFLTLMESANPCFVSFPVLFYPLVYRLLLHFDWIPGPEGAAAKWGSFTCHFKRWLAYFLLPCNWP